MKRPASASAAASAKKPRAVRREATTMTIFSLASFISELLRLMGLEQAGSAARLKLVTGCSGSGAPSMVLRAILGEDAVQELYAAECEASAAYCLSANNTVGHIFENFVDVAARASGGHAFCMLHDGVCRIPGTAEEVHLFCAGFTCKAQSKANNQRFKKSPLESPHHSLFTACVDWIKSNRPQTYVLENVTGVLSAESSENPEPVVQKLMAELLQIDGYTATYATLDARPLPTKRPRVFFVGSRRGSALVIASQIELLAKQVRNMPKHHVKTCLDPQKAEFWRDLGCSDAGSKASPLASLEGQAAYANSVEKARNKAVEKGRLDAQHSWPCLSERESSHSRSLTSVTPWQLAQIDTYEQILKKACEDETVNATLYRVADTSQTASRGAVSLDGTLDTILTGSSYYNYELRDFLDPSCLMAIHGFPDYSFKGCSKKEAMQIIGNMMAASSLSLVLIPVLSSLQFLRSA